MIGNAPHFYSANHFPRIDRGMVQDETFFLVALTDAHPA